MEVVERVRAIVQPVVAAQGLSLYDLELTSGVLRVTVDCESGVDVDAVGEVSQEISKALDETDPVPGSKYLLEVSSPGVERNLRTPEHFAAVVGENVRLRLSRSVEGDRRIEGQLVAAGDGGVDVSTDAEEAPAVHFSYGDIEQARTVFDWDSVFSGAQQQDRNSSKKKASSR